MPRKLADYNIQIQHKTSSRYDKLHPVTLVENIIGYTGLKYEMTSYTGDGSEDYEEFSSFSPPSSTWLESHARKLNFSQPISFIVRFKTTQYTGATGGYLTYPPLIYNGGTYFIFPMLFDTEWHPLPLGNVNSISNSNSFMGFSCCYKQNSNRTQLAFCFWCYQVNGSMSSFVPRLTMNYKNTTYKFYGFY